MPGRVGSSPPNALGYRSYGMPQNLQVSGRGGPAYNRLNTGYPTPGVLQPSGYPGLGSIGVAARQNSAPTRRPPSNPVQLTEVTKRPRPKLRLPALFGTWPGGVQAGLPQRGQLSATASPAVRLPPTVGTRGVNNAPPFQYMVSKPAKRAGPVPKLAPGSALPNGNAVGTGLPPRTRQISRAQGLVAPGYAETQYVDVHQFDYSPPTDASVDLGLVSRSYQPIPPTIQTGSDGRELVGTWKAHDFTPGVRFFKQGRSSGNWQDMTFGPDFRWLQPVQMVGRYNLYSDIQLARQPSQNAYFLQYQTQASIASQIAGANGMGAPLGYGAH